MHSNDRNTAKQGTKVTLKAAFYKDGVLANPTNSGADEIRVDILYGNTIISGNIGDSITPSDLSFSNGIGSASYTISGNAEVGEYTDRWKNVEMYSGDPRNYDFTHNVVENDRQVPYTEGFCYIYTYLTDDAGTPMPNVSGFAYVNTTVSGYSDSPNTLRAVSDSSGRMQWEMPWAAPVIVDIPNANIYKQVTVPSSPQVDLLTL